MIYRLLPLTAVPYNNGIVYTLSNLGKEKKIDIAEFEKYIDQEIEVLIGDTLQTMFAYNFGLLGHWYLVSYE